MIDVLQKSFLFKGVDRSDLENILAEVPYYQKTYLKNELVAIKGNLIENLSVVVSGELVTEMLKENGSVTKIDELMSGQVVAPAFLFSENQVYPVDIRATIDSTLFCISKKDFFTIMKQNHKILENFIKAISNKTEYLSKKIWYNVQYRTIKEKVVAYILNNQSDGYVKIKSIESLANQFSVERPSLSRILSNLVKSKKLEKMGRNEYKVCNIEQLYEEFE